MPASLPSGYTDPSLRERPHVPASWEIKQCARAKLDVSLELENYYNQMILRMYLPHPELYFTEASGLTQSLKVFLSWGMKMVGSTCIFPSYLGNKGSPHLLWDDVYDASFSLVTVCSITLAALEVPRNGNWRGSRRGEACHSSS